MLKRITFLLILNIGFVISSALVAGFTGIAFKAAAFLIIGIGLCLLILLAMIYRLRMESTRIKAKKAMRDAREALKAGKPLLPEFRRAAENIKDRKSREDVLTQISILEKVDPENPNLSLDGDAQARLSARR
jgi:Flp pilus assembly protein TadB